MANISHDALVGTPLTDNSLTDCKAQLYPSNKGGK
jgi:hypothetical protein